MKTRPSIQSLVVVLLLSVGVAAGCADGVADRDRTGDGEDAGADAGIDADPDTGEADSGDAECEGDDECEGPEVCEEGSCLDPCEAADCSTGQGCLEGECYNECSTDDDCQEPAVCDEGLCRDLCADVNCGNGQTCHRGGCYGLCDNHDHCADDERCAGDGRCVPLDCKAVDCSTGEACRGGVCYPACEEAEECPADADVCDNGACIQPTCEDGLENGDETGTDCGGPDCDPCEYGEGCLDDGDCASGVCESGICQQPTCVDDQLNGRETDVDCGGDECPGCDNGKTCETGDDCLSTICEEEVCVPDDTWELVGEYDDLQAPAIGAYARDGSRFAYSERQNDKGSGQVVADGDYDQFVVRDATDGSLELKADVDHYRGRGLALSPDGSYVAVTGTVLEGGPGTGGSNDRRSGQYVYDVETGDELGSDIFEEWAASGADFAPDGQRVAWGRGESAFRMASPSDFSYGTEFSDSEGSPSLEFADDYFVHTDDGGAAVRTYPGFDLEQRFSEYTGSPGLTIADDGSFLAHGVDGTDGDIRVREVGGDWSEITTLSVDGSFRALHASGDGEYLAVRDPGAEEIVVYESGDWTVEQRLDDCGACDARYVEFSAGAEGLVVPSEADGTVYHYRQK